MDDSKHFSVLEQLLSGDDDAFEAFYNHFFNPVYLRCLRLTRGNKELSKDVTQEVFIKVLNYRDNYHNDDVKIDNIYSWLFTYAKNILSDRSKKMNRRIKLKKENYDRYIEPKTFQDHSEDEFLICLECLNSPTDKAILFLEYRGFSASEIAKLFNKKNQWVYSRKFRAKVELRKKLAHLK